MTRPIPDLLARAFALPAFDGAAAQRAMTPASRGAAAAVPPGTPVRDGAALLYVFEDGLPGAGGDPPLAFPLTLRREDLRTHRGQVALPGGRPEPGESLWDAALREAAEEVGLRPGDATPVGALAPVEIPHTHSRLHVLVAFGPDPRPLAPAEAEVAAVGFARLLDLLDPSRRSTTTRRIDGRDLEVPCFRTAGFEVWGATAMALEEVARRLAAARDAGLPPHVTEGPSRGVTSG